MFLCFGDVKKAGQRCHRETQRRWLREHGVRIEEFEPRMLPRRPDAPQQRLSP